MFYIREPEPHHYCKLKLFNSAACERVLFLQLSNVSNIDILTIHYFPLVLPGIL